MLNRTMKCAMLLTALLPAIAVAQQPAERGAGTWEWSAGAGILITDRALNAMLATGTPTTQFTTSYFPARIMPAATVRLGYNFSNNFGFSIGAQGARGSGVTYLTPLAALTWTANLNAKTSPFITAGTQITRITGQNGRKTHPTWGAHLGIGVRSMISENMALRVEGRMASEHYADLVASKSAYPSTATIGFSYFFGGRAAAPAARVVPCPVCATAQRARVDTVMRFRVDTLRTVRVDTVRATVRVVEPSPDQLILRVQFATDRSVLLARSRPVLDTIAIAIRATPGSRWEVQGHTDSVGTAEHNRTLAQARAQAVVDYLVSRGVDRGILSAVGYGLERPVFSNSTVAGRAQNRRVQLRRIPPPPVGEVVP